MANEHILRRLEGIHKQLMGAYDQGAPLSSASKGRERETFVHDFLEKVMPTTFRFGSGDITDQSGKKSGQVDVVIEYPFGPSLAGIGTNSVRLYVAETVAAVVEVKSNLMNQWGEVAATASAVKTLTRQFETTFSMGLRPTPGIPVIAVGFTGWQKPESLQQKLDDTPTVDALMVIDTMLFASRTPVGWTCWGTASLWGLISYLNIHLTSLKSASYNTIGYVSD